ESTVNRWLRRFGITARDRVHARLPLGVSKLTKNELEKLYWEKNLNCVEIAPLVGVSNATISNWMNEYGIPQRDWYEIMGGEKHPKFNGWSSMIEYPRLF